MVNPEPITLLLDTPRNWSAYYRALKEADKVWAAWSSGDRRTYGVFSGRSTYLETIKQGTRVMRSDWKSLGREDAQIALGLWSDDGYDYGLLGSMNGAGRAKGLFLSGTSQDLQAIGAMLRPVIEAPYQDMARLATRAVEGITGIYGISTGVATRLLALARPDALVSVNGCSQKNLAILTGKSVGRLKSPAGYGELIEWTLRQQWWSSEVPTNPEQIAAWNARAALLDCFVYQTP